MCGRRYRTPDLVTRHRTDQFCRGGAGIETRESRLASRADGRGGCRLASSADRTSEPARASCAGFACAIYLPAPRCPTLRPHSRQRARSDREVGGIRRAPRARSDPRRARAPRCRPARLASPSASGCPRRRGDQALDVASRARRASRPARVRGPRRRSGPAAGSLRARRRRRRGVGARAAAHARARSARLRRRRRWPAPGARGRRRRDRRRRGPGRSRRLARHRAGHLHERRVLQDPADRQIALLGLGLAPGGDLAQHRQLASRQAPTARQLQVGLTRDRARRRLSP